MPEFETSIDVDIDEFLDECSDREKKEIIECLIEDEYLKYHEQYFQIQESLNKIINKDLTV